MIIFRDQFYVQSKKNPAPITQSDIFKLPFLFDHQFTTVNISLFALKKINIPLMSVYL